MPNLEENIQFKTSRYKRAFYKYVFSNLTKEEKKIIKFINYCQKKSFKLLNQDLDE